MAPTRRSRNGNKRVSNINEVSPKKNGENANKSRQKVSADFSHWIKCV